MHIERKKDLSIYYYLEDLFQDQAWINVEDGYPETDLQLPTVAVDGRTIEAREYELGNRDRIWRRLWFIEIYAKNKSQRDEIAYRILEDLENGIPVYDYDEGFPPQVNPTQIGSLEILSLRMEIIRIRPELVSKMYYRASVSFTAEYNSY